MSADEALISQWRSLLSRYSCAAHDLDRALQTHGLTMSDYEALDLLICHNSCKARVQDLVDECHLSQSALSRAVARLEKAGLVERTMCDTDRRGVFVMPTDHGRELHTLARDTYLGVLAQHFE